MRNPALRQVEPQSQRFSLDPILNRQQPSLEDVTHVTMRSLGSRRRHHVEQFGAAEVRVLRIALSERAGIAASCRGDPEFGDFRRPLVARCRSGCWVAIVPRLSFRLRKLAAASASMDARRTAPRPSAPHPFITPRPPIAPRRAAPPPHPFITGPLRVAQATWPPRGAANPRPGLPAVLASQPATRQAARSGRDQPKGIALCPAISHAARAGASG